MPDTPHDRRRALIDKWTRHATEYYGPQGAFDGPFTIPDERDRWRTAAILLEHGGQAEQDLAEDIMIHTFGGPEDDWTRKPIDENWTDETHTGVRDWNIFQSNIATAILARWSERLGDAARGKCERLARRNCDRYAASGQADYIFHGANDNMPAHATCGLILAGETLGIDRAVNDGLWRLELFAEMLCRRGLCSEYGSGTYLPLTVNGMAEIAETARSDRARSLALAVEQQLWADIVGFYHPGSGKCGAPMTRAYGCNTIGHLDTIMTLVWLVSGEPSFTDPVRDLITLQPKQMSHFHGDAFKTATGIIFLMLPEFHPPAELLDLLADRPWPFRFQGSAEHIFFGLPEGGGTEANATIYQTPDWSLASSDHGFHKGNQSEKVRLVYRAVEEPQSFKDTGVLFWRYLHGNESPADTIQDPPCPPSETNLLHDRGVHRTLQHENQVLLVGRGAGNVEMPTTTDRLRLATILPAHYHEPQAVFLGDREVTDFTAASADPDPVYIDCGRLYLALFPLVMTDHGRNDLVRLEREGNYRVVSFFNYEDKAREFTAETLRETFTGCLVVVGGPAEDGDFASFRAATTLDVVEDWWLCQNRRTRTRCRGTDLLLNWCTLTGTLRSEAVNGRAPERPLLAGTGIDRASFPLLQDPPVYPRLMPLDNMDIAWYPEVRWQIGRREARD